MPCGWGCGAELTASGLRSHFTLCQKRPGTKAMERILKPVKPATTKQGPPAVEYDRGTDWGA